jgi:hypothetical protein
MRTHTRFARRILTSVRPRSGLQTQTEKSNNLLEKSDYPTLSIRKIELPSKFHKVLSGVLPQPGENFTIERRSSSNRRFPKIISFALFRAL